MNRGRSVCVLVASVGLAIVAAGCGGSGATHLDLVLKNASGIRTGTLVKVGGARVGTVDSLSIDSADHVIARLKLDPDRVRPGAGTRAAITTVNLVGAKFVDLDPGDRSRPLPDGSRIPEQNIGVSTELDQVLDVLDADTRTRLEILINEAGWAFRGRRADLVASLRGLPPSLAAVNQLLGNLSQDNHTIEDLVSRSDRFVAQVTRQRRALTGLVDSAGEAMKTVSARRADLRATLAKAPPVLHELTGVLRDLEATTVPLRPAAGLLARSAPALTTTLSELPAFRASASPTLRKARDAAPLLTQLGDRATPTLRAAKPVLRDLHATVADAAPLTKAADAGIEDLLGLVEGWARSIQARDAVGHMFRGHVTITRDLIDSLAKRLPRPSAGARHRPQSVNLPALSPLPQVKGPVTDAVTRPLETLGKALGGIVNKIVPPAPASERKRTNSLLDYLLGP